MFKNVLFVAAHCDDLEICCGGFINELIIQGVKVHTLILTGNSHRVMESSDGLNVLGVTSQLYGDFLENELLVTGETVTFIDNIVKNNDIDTIVTHNETDSHQDHRNCAQICMATGRNLNNFLQFSTVPFRRIGFDGGEFNYFVDITNSIDKKIEAILKHESQFKRFPKNWKNYIKGQSAYFGSQIQVKHAEAFRVKKLKHDG